MPQGFALETADTLEVIAAYSGPRTVIPAIAGDPSSVSGWYVVGSFYLPRSCDARLDIIAVVSNPLLISRSRLFDMSTLAEVSGSRAIASPILPVRLLSGVCSLVGTHMYQIQSDCVLPTGSVADTDFSVVSSGTISD